MPFVKYFEIHTLSADSNQRYQLSFQIGLTYPLNRFEQPFTSGSRSGYRKVLAVIYLVHCPMMDGPAIRKPGSTFFDNVYESGFRAQINAGEGCLPHVREPMSARGMFLGVGGLKLERKCAINVFLPFTAHTRGE